MYLNLTVGEYAFPLETVAPHQTIEIDIRELRDKQVPDVNGLRIPLGDTSGQVQWSLTGGVDRVLIGRSEQVDLVRGISSNYACQNCCPNSFFDGWLTPVQSTSFEGGQIQFIAMQQDANCYGQTYPPYQAGAPFFTSSDSSICDPGFSTGTTTGVGPGEAVINGAWMADAWFFGPFGVCDYTPEEVLRDAVCEILDCLCVGPPVTDAEWTDLIQDFPNLQRCQTRKHGPATSTYNCMSWTLDDTSRWWWFEADANLNGKLSATELHTFYNSKGKSNIAYYGTVSDVLHVAKKSQGGGPGCIATSKLGQEIRIAHSLPQLEGGDYGNSAGGN